MNEMRETFNMYDSNSDGKHTQNSFRNINGKFQAIQLTNYKIDYKLIQNLFKKGTVSVEELKSIIEKCDINLTDDQFNEMVNSLDKNDDDKIEFDGKNVSS